MPEKKLNSVKILIGVTGGIAAYKTAALVRLFIKNGAEVKVVASKDALEFITPLTLATLSKNPVYSEFYDKESGAWTNHVDLGKWADVMVVAPCTANSLAKMAAGLCDNLLLATYLSADCPVFFAPAMDLDMYAHPSTARNIATLKSFGNHELPAEDGELASGLKGKGRMSEPETIYKMVEDFFKKKDKLKAFRILVNAGPTHEKLDPVRFIGNYSSGKMGIAIANELSLRGAEVDLVLGPVQKQHIEESIRVHHIISAEDMYESCISIFPNVDGAILAAAVADYKPKTAASEKIKKKDSEFQLELEKTKDVLRSLGEIKQKQVLAGFALETNDEMANAQDKLQKKNLDFIVLNSMKDKGAGFEKDTNKVSIIEKKGKTHIFDLKEKTEVAVDIADILEQYLCEKQA
ncbi:MAG: bifunctional phosphopantothenoylcysteine decarboxylase/phosphopantothenate--cysteine ligase CoaBC [Bacteroidia bacterium]